MSDDEIVPPKGNSMIRDRDPELTYGAAKDQMYNYVDSPTFAGNGCYKMRASESSRVSCGWDGKL